MEKTADLVITLLAKIVFPLDKIIYIISYIPLLPFFSIMPLDE